VSVPKISDEAKLERREHVLAGARRCFAAYGYEGATVVRLEAETGLSRGAIFNWFPTKEELFLELAARDNARLASTWADEGHEALVRAVLEEDPAWLGVYAEFGRRLRTDADFRERWKQRTPPEVEQRIVEQIEAAQKSGELRGDLEAKEIARLIGLILDGLVIQRAFGFDPPSHESVTGLLRDALGARAVTRATRQSP
jgi:TetR/AcrR family transcriptional regulator, transcriptional repressor of aconitase